MANQMTGWSLREWIRGNSSTIKELLKIGLPLITSFIVSGGGWWETGLGTIVGKFILDVFHYWLGDSASKQLTK